MISTSVKDVGNVMNALAASTSTSNSSADSKVSFQSVWNQQTNKDGVEQPKTKEPAKAKESEETAKYEQPKVEKNTKPDETDKATETEEVTEVTDTQETEEVDEEVLEVLGSAACEMMQQVADVLGVSLEDVQSTMEALGMEELDILNPNKLGELLLNMSGSEDSLALLTNEELYADYQQVMEQLQSMMQECSETLDMSREELNGLLEQMNMQQMSEEAVEEMPVVEVEIAAPKSEQSETVYIDNLNKTDIFDSAGAVSVKAPEAKQDAGESMEGNAQQSNPFAQSPLEQQQAVQEMESLSQTTSSWDADTQDIMQQIMDYMKIQVSPETTDIEMRLHPESLGTLHVQVASKGGVLTANFITQNETVKAALESQMVQLKENFAEQGVKVEAIEVTVQTHQFERNLDQGESRQNEANDSKKSRTRRINLDASLDTEEIEEEDKLTAEMMAANGSTVDYTV